MSLGYGVAMGREALGGKGGLCYALASPLIRKGVDALEVILYGAFMAVSPASSSPI